MNYKRIRNVKRRLILGFSILVLAGVLTACYRDHLDGFIAPRESASSFDALSVEEARAYFEQRFSELSARSDADISRGLTPGEFTPRWDQATMNCNDHVVAVDIPIVVEYRYRTERIVGKQKRIAAAPQKLVVLKSRKTGKMAQYILMLVPTQGYFATHKKDLCNRFYSTGENDKFSGLAVYLAVSDSRVVMIHDYDKGKRVDGVYLPHTHTPAAYAKVRKMLSSRTFLRISPGDAMTRGFGEMAYCAMCGRLMQGKDCPFCDESIEVWAECDGCGNYVKDCTCYCETCGNPKYSCTCHICSICGNDPCTCDYGGGGDSGGNNECPYCGSPYCNGECQECQYCHSPYCNGECRECPHCHSLYCNGECQTSGGDNQGGGNIGGDVFPSGLPADLSKYFGTPEYYEERHNDCLRRFKNTLKNPPRYYLEYGKKYCTKFKTKTYEKVSDKGKIWIDKVAVYLQEDLEKILKKNPSIELNNADFEKAAFDSHVDAYLRAGILDLPICDKVQIFLTVEFLDLAKPNSITQIDAIWKAQMTYYKILTVLELKAEAYELQQQWNRINEIVEDYLKSQITGGTRSYPTMTKKDIIDLILGSQIEYFYQNVDGFNLPGYVF